MSCVEQLAAFILPLCGTLTFVLPRCSVGYGFIEVGLPSGKWIEQTIAVLPGWKSLRFKLANHWRRRSSFCFPFGKRCMENGTKHGQSM
uniref:Putative secreted protein n=1 Tax=Ixodes ricinus TaxID=34613 RepID=A0A6B0UB40_IXORI